MAVLKFPENFLWGAAASAYQIEGAYDLDGKGESIWDRFVQWQDHILNGDTGNTACSHYQLMPQDVALFKDLGLQCYSLGFWMARSCASRIFWMA